jgi:hypothetical protein
MLRSERFNQLWMTFGLSDVESLHTRLWVRGTTTVPKDRSILTSFAKLNV